MTFSATLVFCNFYKLGITTSINAKIAADSSLTGTGATAGTVASAAYDPSNIPGGVSEELWTALTSPKIQAFFEDFGPPTSAADPVPTGADPAIWGELTQPHYIAAFIV